LWLGFAHALGYTETGKADLDVLRDTTAADYLIQTADEQTGSVARLFHQALVDELLSGHGRNDHRAVFQAVLDDVESSGGWAGQSQYARMFAAEYAADAGELGTLLDDTDFLGRADLTRLVPVLTDVPPADRPPMAAVVLMAAGRAARLHPDLRLRLLALTAAHVGVHDSLAVLSRALAPGLQPVWAHSLGHPNQRLTDHTGSVCAVAIGRLGGRDVIVSAGTDDTVRIWDEHGVPVGEPLTGHTASVVAVGRLGGRDVIVSAEDASTVRIWDEHGVPVEGQLTGYTDGVMAVAVGQLGGRDVIVSAGFDHTVGV
jgi:hypothetical protein